MSLNRLERVLLAVIDELKVTTVLGPYRATGYGSDVFERDDRPGHWVHFAPWLDGQIESGMIVIAGSTHNSRKDEFSIGEVVQVLGHGDCVIRDLRDGQLCRLHNERFVPIIGLRPDELWTDDQVVFDRKVRKAFLEVDDFIHQYDGVVFEGDIALISVANRNGAILFRNRVAVPYVIEMKWNRRLTIKSIKHALLEAGYGQCEFEYVPSLSKIGVSPKSVEMVGEVAGQNLYLKAVEVSCRQVVKGYCLRVYLDRDQIRHVPSGLDRFLLNITAADGEKFVVTVSGIKKVRPTEFYKDGFEFIAEEVKVDGDREEDAAGVVSHPDAE